MDEIKININASKEADIFEKLEVFTPRSLTQQDQKKFEKLYKEENQTQKEIGSNNSDFNNEYNDINIKNNENDNNENDKLPILHFSVKHIDSNNKVTKIKESSPNIYNNKLNNVYKTDNDEKFEDEFSQIKKSI